MMTKGNMLDTLRDTPKKAIGHYLVESDLLTAHQIELVLNEQRQNPVRIGRLIAEKGWVSQQTIDFIVERVIEPERQAELHKTSPQMTLVKMLTGTWPAQCIYVAATLGIADLLKDGAKSIDELAELTESYAPNLYRMLRALASVSVFAEVSPKCFSLTEMAEYLCCDHPKSLRELGMMLSDKWHWDSWGDVLHVVKTGQPPLQHLYQVNNAFEYFQKNPPSGKLFDKAISGWAKNTHAAIVHSYDFSGIETIVDVAGGHGALIAAILNANPHMKGVLFDLPHVISEAKAFLQSSGVAHRCATSTGNFFHSVPPDGDAYIIAHTIHNWDNEACLSILQSIRKSMPHKSRLLVLEMVMPVGNEPHFSKWLDLDMLMMFSGGRERTEAEYRELFSAAGFELTQIVPTSCPSSIIEGVCI
ncbi:methyltransferase [Altericista sp. CCNU0014]|uniref:methyltransferase n=1 Tax=Altericista sp. CCNU0014 TaxID=3082949 RepID=UPI00384CF2F0